MGWETRVAQTDAIGLTVDVGVAVALVSGESDATFSTVTAEQGGKQCAVARVTKVIAVCCP